MSSRNGSCARDSWIRPKEDAEIGGKGSEEDAFGLDFGAGLGK